MIVSPFSQDKIPAQCFGNNKNNYNAYMLIYDLQDPELNNSIYIY